MDERFVDFDAARAEHKREPLMLRAYGETFELPASMPAGLFLDIVELESAKGKGAEVSNIEALQMMRRLMPVAVLDGLLAREDFGLDDLTDLLGMVMAAYQGQKPGGAPAPNRATRRKAFPTP